jgi:hypothetical protein
MFIAKLFLPPPLSGWDDQSWKGRWTKGNSGQHIQPVQRNGEDESTAEDKYSRYIGVSTHLDETSTVIANNTRL